MKNLILFAAAMILLVGLFSCQKKKVRNSNVTCNIYEIKVNDVQQRYDTVLVYTQQIETTKTAQQIENEINSASVHPMSYVDCN